MVEMPMTEHTVTKYVIGMEITLKKERLTIEDTRH